jgi:predicted solute-binding protein
VSKQSQFAMLGRVVNPREYAADLLRQDVVPALTALGRNASELEAIELREVLDEGLYLHRAAPGQKVDDLAMLGAMLRWFLASKLAQLPQPIVDQIASRAARALDYPAIEQQTRKHAEQARTAIARNAADASHVHDRKIREDAIAAYIQRRTCYASKDKAAEALALEFKRSFRTVRGWLTGL